MLSSLLNKHGSSHFVVIRTAWKVAEYVFVCSVLVLLYCSGLQKVAFHPDESSRIASSSAFEAYVKGESSSPLWQESDLTLTQPPLPLYVIGIGRSIGGFGTSAINRPWDSSTDFKTNEEEGNLPSVGLLWWSRLPMAILAAVSIFLGFLLLKRVAGRVPGYIWVGSCLISPYFLIILRRAVGEAPLLASIVLVMLVSFKLLQVADKEEARKTVTLYFYFAILGVGVGLAESSKLNGLSAIGAGLMLSFIVASRMIQETAKRVRFTLLSFFVLALASQFTWIGLNPYLWPDPVSRTVRMFAFRMDKMGLQVQQFPDDHIATLDRRVHVVTTRVFQTFAVLNFSGSRLINIGFFLIGLSYVVLKAFLYLGHVHSNPASIALVLVGATVSIPALLTPLDWARYYLLPVFFSTLCIVIGVWGAWLFGYRSVTRLVNRRRTSGRRGGLPLDI